MAEYQRSAYPLAHAAVEACLDRAGTLAASTQISDLFIVSCTGYTAPGLDIHLAADLAFPRDVRRVVIAHMGCVGALVGIRQGLAVLQAHHESTVLLVSVELCSLHFTPTNDPQVLTSFAHFGDAAAALLLGYHPEARGPQVVDTCGLTDFASADHMSWTITDHGFAMSLSPRIPVTLRRIIPGVVAQLLAPHGLAVQDVTQWIVHPGGRSILEAIAGKLDLSDEQMAPSRQVLAEHGNCSSATVLLILGRILREGRAQPGEWGMMMAFGPGLTLDTCLLCF